ncbi:hypothetical protein DFH09DRAFT_1282420 [Mycena vulgaris]|nr:hypothetical protein DFH09DRAFT_1282420 [Mycena vulgaris]
MPRPVGSAGQKKAAAEQDRESKILEAVDLANKGTPHRLAGQKQYCGTLKTGGECPRRLVVPGSRQKKGSIWPCFASTSRFASGLTTQQTRRGIPAVGTPCAPAIGANQWLIWRAQLMAPPAPKCQANGPTGH